MFSQAHHVNVNGGNFLTVEGDYNRSVRVEKRRGIDILLEGVAEGALHNSGERFDPPKCHPNTRTAVLQRIMDWIQNDDPSSPEFMWIYGPAGSGKSAIAQSIAELCYEYGFLLGTFFFSRSVAGRNDDKRLAATIAYQIGQSYTEALPLIEESVERNPALLSLNLEAQLKALIIEPLLKSAPPVHAPPRPRLIIIDGLDECQDPRAQTTIIRTFTQLVRAHKLPFIILFASRTEHQIREAFNDRIFDTNLCRIALDNTLWRADDDIREFLISRFQNIHNTHQMKSYLPRVWPLPEVIEKLVVKSSGQFIYASTVIRYVEEHGYHPTNRLETVLGLRSIENGTPFAELDDLYRHILSTVEDYGLVSRILGYLLLDRESHWQSTPDFLDEFFSLQKGTAYLAISNLHSILNYPDNEYHIYQRLSVTMIHASFGDFLFDPSRSGIYFLDPSFVHTDIAICCFQKIAETDMFTFFLQRPLLWHCSRARITQKFMECLSSFDLTLWTKITAESNFHRFLPDYCALLSDLGVRELIKRHIDNFDSRLLSEIREYCYSKMAMWCYIVLGGKWTLAECSKLMDERWDRPEPPRNLFQSELGSVSIWHSDRQSDCFNFLRQFFYDIDRAGEYAMSDDSHLCVTLYLMEKLLSKFFSHWTRPVIATTTTHHTGLVHRPSSSIHSDPLYYHPDHYDFIFDPEEVLTAALLSAPLSNKLFSRVSSTLRQLDFCDEDGKSEAFEAQTLLTNYLKRCQDDPSFSGSKSTLS